MLSGAAAAAPDNALQLNGSSQYVRFGTVTPAPGVTDALNASQFTLELWFNRTGAGAGTATSAAGGGGLTSAVPLIAKGRGEGDNSNVDMNYFLGIDTATNRLAADFEEGVGAGQTPGLNHAVVGTTTITNNVWHHAAVSYDGTWRLYLDGKLETTLAVGRTPRSDSIQRTALGSALTSAGAAAGFFQGVVDEARIWNVALPGSQIRASRNNEILSATTNLIGRWGLDEGSGTTAADTSTSGLAGTLVATPLWVAGYTFPQDVAAPSAVSGLTANAGDTTAALSWSASSASDLAGYNVFRSTTTPVPTTGTPLNGVDLLQATSFNDTGLTNGTTYHYAVVAVDTSNNSSASSETSATPQAPTPGQNALGFASAQSEYVSFGAAAGATGLGAQNLTVETWFRRTGAGVGTSTGDGGLPSAIPLVTKGRAQAETPANLNMNYFLGLDSGTGVVVADFEDTATGGNHPVSGVTSVLPDGSWHHVAATYDGDEWRLYLDGKLDRKLLVGNFTPESTSVQHAAVGSALTSGGAASGFFQGEIDESRVWNLGRTGAQIRSAKDDEIASDGPGGLIGRWGYNEGSPATTTADTTGRGNTGTLFNTPTWVNGYTFAQDVSAPSAPSGLNATAGNGSVSLSWTASGSPDVAGYEVFRSTTTPVGTGASALNGADLVGGTSFSDDTAVNGTTYFYAVRAVDSANNPSALSNEDSAMPTGGDPVFVGAGDVADCARTEDTATAALVATIPGHVFTVGDNVYPNGTDAEFANCYDPVWGQFNDRIRPAPGNHDYNTPGASGYFNYFNGVGAQNGIAGDRNLGYYSYDIIENGAAWHVVVLNSECEPTGGLWLAGGCAAGSTQEQWLRSDLAGASTNNIIAVWHKPRFGSGGNHAHMQALWQALYDFGVDLSLGGHWHNYERFAPLNAQGAVDNSFGVRSFIVGTGGAGLSGFGTAPTGSQLRDNNTHGIMKFTLHQSSYDWEFIPIAGQTFTDSGTQAVHGPPPAPTGGAFRFNGSNQFVEFGPATSSLGASTLTLETWFRRTAAGVGTNTGTGGFGNAIPLITKGRGEAEDSNVDMNYFLGINATSSVLVADFEDSATGANHPASGTTAIPADGTWHHAAATYDGDEWRLYLDGKQEARTFIGSLTPRSDSIQHAALASALNSTGVEDGFFAGDLDEARIWGLARTGSQIRSAKDDEITGPATGLKGRWSLNDTTGTTVTDTSGNGTNGTAAGNPGRVAGYGFLQDTTAPAAPTGLAANAGDGSVGLAWTPSSGSDVAGYDVFRSTSPGVDTSGPPLNGGDLVTSPSFLDANATNGVTYYYAVRAVDSADNPSGLSGEASATPVPGDPVFVGAGDIADCGRTQDTATAALVAGIPGQVFTIGDNVYPNGTDAEFANCYEPTWGAFKSRTRPTPGNHDYNTPGATGYYNYFNGLGVENGAAGDRDLGYYSYEITGNGVSWHVVVLNSDCEESTSALWLQNGCVAGSAQEQWLRTDLANAPTNNIIALWHKPRFASGTSFPHMQALWQALYDHGVDLALFGHWHNYERFAPANGAGQPDGTFGVRSFIIGTGGAAVTGFGATHALSQVRNSSTYGVMKFTLHASSYDWQFVPISGQTFTDSGTQAVHGRPDTAAPVVDVVSAVPASLGAADSSTVVTWNATENGLFSVRVGGTSCSSGTEVQSGSYTTTPADRSTTVNATSLADGPNTIRVCVTDAANNTGSATIDVTKDTSAPVVDVVSAAPAAVGAGDTSTSVTWNATENGSFSVRVGGTDCVTGTQVDSGAYSSSPANAQSIVSASALAEGANTIRVCVMDGAGNNGSDSIAVNKDTTAPTVTAVSANPVALGAGDTSTTITWNSGENGGYSIRVGGADCATGSQIDSGSYATAPANATTAVPASALAEGSNTIRVCVTDSAGNIGSDTIDVSKDTAAPTVQIVSAEPTTLGTADPSTIITWNAGENGSFSVRVGGTSCSTGTEVGSGTYATSPANRESSIAASALAEGENTIRVCVTDAAANSGSDTTNVAKDTTVPTVVIDSAEPETLGAGSTSTVITWRANENGGYSVRVGGTDCATSTQVDSGSYVSAPQTTTATVPASALAEGANTVRVCVTDAAGNSGSDTTNVGKDTTAPTVHIVSAQPSTLGAGDSSTTITWHADENGTYSVRVGDCATGTQVASGNYATAPADLTSSVPASSLAEGANTIRVCALDAASNTGADLVTVTKDTAAPTVAVVSAEPAALGAGHLGTTVTWNASDNGTFSVRVGGTNCTTGTAVDSGTYASSPADRTSNVAASALAEGANTIRVCLTDGAGNTGNGTIGVTKDTVAPVVGVVSAVPATLGPGNASTLVTWNANENGSYSVRVGGSDCSTGSQVGNGSYTTAPASTTATVPANALAEGANTIRVCVTDSADNTGNGTIGVSKDTTAPATPSITSSSPSSPAEDNNPKLIGTAEAGSTVRLYTTADCSGTVAASDTAAAFASPGLTVTVGEDSTTTFYARATDAAGNPSACSGGFTYVEASGGPPPADPLLLSFLTDGTAGALAFADEDIVAVDGSSFSVVFDGSDVGLGALNVDAFSFLDENSILLSFATAGTIGALGTVDDSDVVRFDATSLGSTTNGTFSLFFDGSDVSLTSDAEDVDAIQQLADGRLVLSTVDTPSIGGVSSPRDEDLLAFTPTSLGDVTAGTYAMHFEGSDVGLSNSAEDLDGAWTSRTGEIYLSTFGAFAVTGGLAGADEDVFVCTPTSLGTTTACNFAPTLLFDGSAFGLAANNIDGVGRMRGPVLDGEAPSPPSNLGASAVGATRIDLSWTASDDNVGVTQYRVFRNGTDVGPTQSTSFSDTGLQPSTLYSYVVRAYDQANNASAPSDPAEATTGPADEVLTFPVNADTFIQQASPTANNGAATAVGVDGSPVQHVLLRFVAAGINGRQVTSARIRLHCVDSSSSGGTFFRAVSDTWAENAVNWNDAPAATGGALSSLGSVSSGTWYETSVAGAVIGDGTYSFRVTSTNSNGADYASKERGGGLAAQLIVTVAGTPPQPDDEAPSTPENLDAVAVGPRRVDLSWTASTDNRGVQGYKIYRDGIQVATTSGTGTTFSDTGVEPNTPYTYNVAAFDTKNTSLQSLPDSVTTPPEPPGPTTLTFSPDEDAYVRSDQAATNFGTATTLQVDGSPEKKFLLKFTVAGVGARTVQSAKLRLHAVDASPNGGEVHGADSNAWSESSIIWNTPFVHNPAVLASFGPVSSGTWYELELKTYFNGDGTKTIVVTTPASDGADYVSKEGTAALRPQLVLTVQ